MWLTKKFVMENFANEAKKGKYKRIDYITWHELQELPEEWDLNFEHYSDWCCATISWNGCNWPYEFDITDNSLGTYIYDLIGEYDTSISISSSTSSISNAFAKCAEAANKIKQSWANIAVKENTILFNGKPLEEIIDDATGVSVRKENDDMNLFKGFEFGSCEKDNVKVSIYGVAVKNASGTWVSYDSKSGNVVDVDVFNFDAKYLYKMPVAIKDIKAGDTIIHCRKPVFVIKNENGKISCIDPAAAEEKIVLPVKNIFGFDFAVKIVNLFEGMEGFEAPSADQPFGNMLPFMMLADGASDMTPMMLAMMMQQGGTSANFNPLMLYALTSNKSNDNLLPLMLLSNPGFGLTPQTATKK